MRAEAEWNRIVSLQSKLAVRGRRAADAKGSALLDGAGKAESGVGQESLVVVILFVLVLVLVLLAFLVLTSPAL